MGQEHGQLSVFPIANTCNLPTTGLRALVVGTSNLAQPLVPPVVVNRDLRRFNGIKYNALA